MLVFPPFFRCTYEFVVDEYLHQYREDSTAQHSTAQHSSTITPARRSKLEYVPIRVRIERRMYVHACGVRVQFLALKCWTIYYVSHSVPLFLVSERSGRTARYAKRLVLLPTALSPLHYDCSVTVRSPVRSRCETFAGTAAWPTPRTPRSSLASSTPGTPISYC